MSVLKVSGIRRLDSEEWHAVDRQCVHYKPTGTPVMRMLTNSGMENCAGESAGTQTH